jgi:hypothetical protein
MTMTQSVLFEGVHPDDLAEVSDETFKAVVDADLRRSTKSGLGFPAELSEALRGPMVRERWRAELERMLASVNGQIDAEDVLHDARVADLRRSILMKESHLIGATPLAARAVERELHGLRVQVEELAADHGRGQARRVRFRSGVEEGLITARFVVHGSEAERLAAGIRAHRKGLLDEEIEPNGFDLALWDLASGAP